MTDEVLRIRIEDRTVVFILEDHTVRPHFAISVKVGNWDKFNDPRGALEAVIDNLRTALHLRERVWVRQ